MVVCLFSNVSHDHSRFLCSMLLTKAFQQVAPIGIFLQRASGRCSGPGLGTHS